MNHLPLTTHGNTHKERAMVSASPSRHRQDKKGGASKLPATIVPSLLAPPTKKAVEIRFDRYLLTFRDWMTAASLLLLSVKDHADGAINPGSLLIQTRAEDDRMSQSFLVFAMGCIGLNLDFNDDMAVELSENTFNCCQFHLFKNGMATPGVASLLYEVNIGDRLMDRLEAQK